MWTWKRFIIVVAAASWPCDGIPKEIAVRSSGTPSVEVTALIAEVATPIKVVVPPNESILSEIERLCGNNLAYLEIAQSKFDQDLSLKNGEPFAKTYTIPACLPTTAPTLVQVKPGDNLTSIARSNGIVFQPRLDSNAYLPVDLTRPSRELLATTDSQFQSSVVDAKNYMGVVPQADKYPNSQANIDALGIPEDFSRGLAVALRASTEGFPSSSLGGDALSKWNTAQSTYAGITNNWSIRSLNGLPQDFRIDSGQLLALPESPGSWVSFSVPDGDGSRKVSALIRALGGNPNNSPSSSTPTEHEQLVMTSDSEPFFWLGINNDDCGPDGGGSAYAISSNELNRIMRLNDEALGRPALPPGQLWPRILVLDTGFPDDLAPDILASVFPEQNRFLMTPFGGTISTDTVGALTTTYKVNAATKSQFAAPPLAFDGERWHGLAVALTSIGGTELEDLRKVEGKPLPVWMGVASLLDDEANPKITFSAILNALVLAVDNHATIINASFMFPTRPDGSDSMIGWLGRDKILVVASGNDGVNLDETDYFPARLGGNPSHADAATVITVGMVDTNGKVHPKSTFGREYVDLFAPGCRIGSYTLRAPIGLDDTLGASIELDQGTLESFSWTGTSFAAPQVSLLSALLSWYNLTPRQIKARIYYSVEFDPMLEEKAFSSGLLNFGNALAFPFDIITAPDRTQLFGDLQESIVNVCGRELSSKRIARLSFRGDDVFIWPLPNHPSADDFEHFRSCRKQAGDVLSLSFLEIGSQSPKNYSFDGVRDLILSLVR